MEKTKINYYLFAIFVVLLLLNIFFYFFGGSLLGWLFYAREKILAQTNHSDCPGSDACTDFVSACFGGGGGGGDLQINEFKVQTFLCGDPDWNQDPWYTARQDGTPSSTAPRPSTTSPPSQTCNVTNVDEPIHAILKASSTGLATLKIKFIDKKGNVVREKSININGNGELSDTYKPPRPSLTDTEYSTLGTTTVEASICTNNNCLTTSTIVKVYQYQCGMLGFNTGFCFARIASRTAEELPDDSWCQFWINTKCKTQVNP